MKIGLIDLEPKIFNTALMQIAQYYRQRGDTVEWWTPITHGLFDKVYCSSLFDFTDKSILPLVVICGGTGFDVKRKLSPEIEACDLDYSIYPKCKTSYIWFSRGCNRKCPWCVVPEKEGKFHLVKRKRLNPNGSYITIMDNDFFANPNWRDVILWLGNMPVDIQGIDVRTLNAEKCHALDDLRRWKNKQFKMAWDDPAVDLTSQFTRTVQILPPRKIMCYVLIGFNSTEEQDLYRIETLRDLKIDPFVMPYNKKDPYQKRFARYVNHKAIFKTVEWKDYK